MSVGRRRRVPLEEASVSPRAEGPAFQTYAGRHEGRP
jgi:hypothetical protein